MRSIPSFSQNHTVDPPIPWEEWSNLFQLAVIAKKNTDIENFLNLIERYHPQPPILENHPDSETETQKFARLDRNFREHKASASIKVETKRFNGTRIEEADKKHRSVLYLFLGKKRKNIFG